MTLDEEKRLIEQERPAFEVWAADQEYDLERYRGLYAKGDTFAAFKGWTGHAEQAEADRRDAERLDWLEARANEPGGLLLHDGSEKGRVGLGLRPGMLDRTLREAIDAAMGGKP